MSDEPLDLLPPPFSMPPRARVHHTFIGPIRRLSVELIEHTLSFLPRTQLPIALRVSKTWFKAGAPLLYAELRLINLSFAETVRALSSVTAREEYSAGVRTVAVHLPDVDHERPASANALQALSNLLSKVLTTAKWIEKLSLPHLPSIYHWLFADVQLPRLSCLEISAYILINAHAFVGRHSKTIKNLQISSEWKGTEKAVLAWHRYFDASTVPRLKNLRTLAVDLHFAPALVRQHASILSHLAIDDYAEVWHRRDNAKALLKDTFAALAETEKLQHFALRLRSTVSVEYLAKLLEGCDGLPLVMTLTLWFCPWSDCDCLLPRILDEDAPAVRSIASYFPDLSSLRFTCPGKRGRKVHTGLWASVTALQVERHFSLPEVREIEYQDDSRGVTIFWHAFNAEPGAPVRKNRHPFNVIPGLGRR